MRCAGDLEKAVSMDMESGETDAGEEAQYDSSVMPGIVVLLSVVCAPEGRDSQCFEIGDGQKGDDVDKELAGDSAELGHVGRPSRVLWGCTRSGWV